MTVSPAQTVPTAWRTHVRHDECDALGHVNNALYLAYLQQATIEIWRDSNAGQWQLRRFAVEYVAPAIPGVELEVLAWPEGLEGEVRFAGYVVRRAHDQAVLVRARLGWAAPSAPAAWPIDLPDEQLRSRPLRLSPSPLDSRPFYWRHTVRRHELSISGYASSVDVLRWIEETKFAASAQAGWTLERMTAADLVIVQIRHDGEFLRPIAFGEQIEIRSRVIDLRRVKGAWRHEVFCRGQLAAIDYSSGAFLHLSGQPRQLPPALVEALLAGDSTLPPVISVVAKSGAGKTTFMEKLIPALKGRGLRVGVVKHHSHATPFDTPGKDTFRHTQAGAEVVVGASAVQVAVFHQVNDEMDLQAVIARHCAGLDLVLTEGYKRGPYPKIEVHRAERGPDLICEPTELLALVSDQSWEMDVPQFALDDANGVADFLLAWLGR